LLIVAISALAAAAFAQTTGPSDSKGVTTKPMGSIDLSTEIDGLYGRQLRARMAIIEPGGHIAMHNHKDRPTMEFVVQGNVIEIRNGVEVSHGPGDIVVADKGVSHWWENRGTVPVVLLPVDIYKP
jgi:mannose-6-phosphate isomerase-like protein (cupin superfamily)